jgi:hypothetical protein
MGMSEHPSKPASSGGLILLCAWCSERNGIPTPQKHGLHERRNWNPVRGGGSAARAAIGYRQMLNRLINTSRNRPLVSAPPTRNQNLLSAARLSGGTYAGAARRNTSYWRHT